jgi:hypothetical protein
MQTILMNESGNGRFVLPTGANDLKKSRGKQYVPTRLQSAIPSVR